MLNQQEGATEAYHICSIVAGAPTCADDTALCSSTLTDAKIVLSIAEADSINQRYLYSTTKSKVMIVNPNPVVKEQLKTFPVNLLQSPLEESVEETHLSVQRVPDDRATKTVSARITSSRRAMYAMMGAGLHGLNGLNPVVSNRLLDTYIVPRLLYGLEAMLISEVDVQRLETAYRNILRQIQHLPKNTAIPAICLMIGAIPIEGQLDIQVLSLFNRILLQEKSLEYDIVRRQLAVKDFKSHSWVTMVRKVLSKYNLPSAYTLLQQKRKKPQWKRQVKEAVVQYWNGILKHMSSQKKTLKYINIDSCSVDKPHQVYTAVSTDPMKVVMLAVKVKLMTQRYPLASTYCAGKQRKLLCPVCEKAPETLQHFLLECEVLDHDRRKYLRQIQENLTDRLLPPLATFSLDWYTQLLLDPSTVVKNQETQKAIEEVSLKLIYSLHHRRAVALGGGSRYVWARSKGQCLL
jgi:hypothetical protein